MLSNRHFKGCFGDVLESAVTRLPLYASDGRTFNPAKSSGAPSGQGFNPAKKSGATRLPLGGFLAEPSANPTRTVTLLHPS
jgi:hypothetical protein